MNESEQNFCFEDRRLSLIDVSFEDDCLYSSPSHDFHVRVSDAAKTEAKSNLGFTDANYTQFDGGEVGAEPVESMEAERMKKKKKYNLRKSIAWDSAFFTSAGVLEPEELSTMMGGGKHMLPGIDEDIHKSTDSISTLASDNLTLENLETDLFGDIRASIQRSTKGSDVGNSTSEAVSLETENTSIPSLEKADVASQNKLKAKTAPNKLNAVMQGTEKIAKQSTPVNGESKSQCRPPKIASRAGPILAPATKRASLGANRVKVEKSKDSPENEKRLTGRGAKVPALGGPRNVVPRPTLPVKSSLRSSSALKTQLKTSLGVGSSGSLSSDNSSKSSLNFMRRKDDSRTGNHSSSTSNVKTTLKLPSRNKNQSTSSHLPPYLKSVNKRSSNISPASSISEWSSASLSPTSTLNKMSNSSRSSFDISSCKDASRDSDASQVMDSQHYFNDEHSVGHGPQVGSVGKCVNKATEGSSSVLHPDSVKPSGLRLPSPKIGFFDGVRSATRTPNRSKQSHEALPSGLPGSGAGSVSPSGGSNEAKLGKLQPARTAVRGTRIMDQVTASGMKSKSTLPLQESSIAALRVSSAVKNEKRNASISLKAQNRMSFQGERKSNLKDKKVVLEECNKSLNNSDGGYTERNGDACFLKGEKVTESKGDAPEKDTKITLCNGLPDITTDSSSIPKVENITSLEKLSGDVICSHNYIKDSLPYPYGTNEKEKAFIEDRVDGLTKKIGAVDFYIEMHKETVGDSLLLFKDDVSRADSGNLEESKHSSKPTRSMKAMASTIVEAEAGIEKDFVEDQVNVLTKQVRAVDFHLDMNKEGGADSLSPSQHDAIRVDSGILEQCKELSKAACSPVPDIASSMVETEKAEAGLYVASAEDQVDGFAKEIGPYGIHVEMHKDVVGDSLSFSQDDVGRVHSHIGEQFKGVSNHTSSLYPAIASTMVEAEKAEAGIEKVSVEGLVDSLTKQIGALDIHVMHKEPGSDSLSHSQDDVNKVDFGIQEEYNELSNHACSATPARVGINNGGSTDGKGSHLSTSNNHEWKT